MGVPTFRLSKPDCAVVTIISSDIDIFKLFARLAIQKQDVYVNHSGPQVIRRFQSIDVEIARGSYMRRVSKGGAHNCLRQAELVPGKGILIDWIIFVKLLDFEIVLVR